MDASNPPELTPEFLQQHPLLAIGIVLFSGLVLLFITGALSSWVLIFVRWWKRLPILPRDAWSPRVWGLVDVLAALVMVVAMQFLAVGLAVQGMGWKIIATEQEPGGAGTTMLSLSALVSASYLVTILVILAWMVLRYRVGISHIGFTAKKLPKHLSIGLIAGFATLPFIYALSAAVSLGFNAEYKHPVLEALKADGSLTGYLLACFAAVIGAPIAEEFLFRVIIQGWLQSIPFSSLAAAVLGASESRRQDVSDIAFYHPASARVPSPALAPQEVDDKDLASPNTFPAQVNNPYQPAPVEISGGISREIAATQTILIPPIWPAIVTGVLFGLAHWGFGLSFVPLIVLGIVLGLLYRATNSIWPCILVHFMLNASSMLALGINILLVRATE